MRVLEQTYSKLSLSLVPYLFCRFANACSKKDGRSQIFNFAPLFPDFRRRAKRGALRGGRGGGQMEPEMGVFSAGYSLSGGVLQL